MRARSIGFGAALVAALIATGCSSETTPDAESSADPAAASVARTTTARRRPTQEELKHPKVVVTTSLGKFTLELDAEKAPITVSNFLDYVDRGFYDGTVFHQVVADYIALAGGYDSELAPKPAGPAIRNEAHNQLPNARGTIAMARSADAIDSSTSQFFLNLADNDELNHRDIETETYGYCVFGRVVEGLETVDRIGQVPVADADAFPQKPVETVRIETIRRLR